MARYIQIEYPNREKIFVFANTGKEREETLEFIQECDNRWNLNVVWVEAVVNPTKGIGTTFRIVDFNSAHRGSEIMDSVYNKYGMFNSEYPHCTRELKQMPIYKYVCSLKFEKEDVVCAIGIRADEQVKRGSSGKSIWPHRMYPLIHELPVNKKWIRDWWKKRDFDLQLAEHQGNCDLCWKKSLRKRMTLIAENPAIIKDWVRWETNRDIDRAVFDRDRNTIPELVEMAKKPFKKFIDTDAITQSVFDPEMDYEMSCMCF